MEGWEPARRIRSITSGDFHSTPALHNGGMFTPGSRHPNPVALSALCDTLADLAKETAEIGPWRSGAFASLARSGGLAGFIPADCGGSAATEPALLDMLAAIAARCLTTALALTQWASACRIIAGGEPTVRSARLPALARGDTPTTVGLAQLSTSRRHLGAPAMVAARSNDTWRLTGLCPWVTGADSSDTIVTGAITASGEQLFFVVPTAANGLDIAPPMQLLALSGSRTSSVVFREVEPADVIRPTETGVRTGGLATTALAVGSTRAAIAILDEEALARPALEPVAAGLRAEVDELWRQLDAAAVGAIEPADRDRLRAHANGLVVRAAQVALTASKGAGFVAGHPAERLVRESMFFLVWSCPQSVTSAVMCELAGIGIP
jgi:alkylation response protein AidB-like acyl-CoA dehydrogenase